MQVHGRGAIIGAGSIVTRDVPAYTVVAGVPAKAIRRRFSEETIAAIEKSRWWEKDLGQLREVFRTNPDAVLQPDPDSLALFDM